MKTFKIIPMGVLIGLLALTCPVVLAQDSTDSTTEDLAKAAQNPIANLISLPLQNNTNFDTGPDERTHNVFNVQPVWPVTLNENWNFITRTILPVVSQPLANGERENGLGDTTFTGFFSPTKSDKLTWGVGPIVLIPTATDDALGADEWGGGLSVVVLTQPGNWVVGSLFSNVWTPEEDNGDRAVNLFTWQYFINYNIPNGKGLYLTSAPINTANWEADSGNQWTIPIGGGVGKIFNIGKQPVNGTIQAYYNVEKPEFGADWQLRLQLQFLFPK